ILIDAVDLLLSLSFSFSVVLKAIVLGVYHDIGQLDAFTKDEFLFVRGVVVLDFAIADGDFAGVFVLKLRDRNILLRFLSERFHGHVLLLYLVREFYISHATVLFLLLE